MTDRARFRFEIAVAVLLGLSALLSAWSGYQCVRWSGRQAGKYSEADALRSAANRLDGIAHFERGVDQGMFAQWLTATAQNHTAVAEFYRQRFSPPLAAAFDRWMATDPIKSVTTGGPFTTAGYVLDKEKEVERLVHDAEAAGRAASDANEQADAYQLLTVSLAMAMFLAGVAPPLRSSRTKRLVLTLSGFVLLTCAVALARYPVE